MRFILLVTLICFSLSVEAISFSKAKTKMYKEVFNNTGTTFYCDCEWSNRKTKLSTCGLEGYFPKKERKRAGRTEAEHIIPASWLLKVNKKYRQCALDSKRSKDSKRDYCRKNDSDYKNAHNDLVNLYPAVGQINADRSNKPFLDEVKIKKEGYGRCNATSGKRGFVPPNNRKGDIARVAFYMSKTYRVIYSKRQQELFEEWDKLDPISEEERKHNGRIIKVQGFGINQ